jgi:hypothetical protein
MDELSPGLFLDRLLGFQDTAALKAAVRLGLFDALREPATAGALAAKLEASEKGLRVLCDFLTVQGFLLKSEGSYALTPASRAYLTRASPTCVAQVMDFLADDCLVSAFLSHPEETVRHGGALGLGTLEPEHPIWVAFAKAMVPFAAPAVAAVANEVAKWRERPRRVLDVAAGHGLFGIALGQLSNDCEVTALDWGPVLGVARENANAARLGGRFHELAGDALELDWGRDFDVVLLPNFLHHFDEDACVELLKKAWRSTAGHGKTLVIEFVPNEDRVSPAFPARFAYMMLNMTQAGDAYPRSALQRMRGAAGFASVTFAELPPSSQTLAIYEK